MSNPLWPKEFAADVERLLNQTLDDEGVCRLETALVDNPRLQHQFLEYCQLHTDLCLSIASDRALEVACHDIGRSSADVASPRWSWRTTARQLAKPTPLSMTIATLVIGVLITAMYFMVPPAYRAMTRNSQSDEFSHEVVAQLTGIHDVVWPEGQVGVNLGSHLLLGHRMDLLEGSAELTYDTGVRVILEAPATFVVQGRNAAALLRGRLVASVPAAAVGFEVETPSAVITDLGTEFGVAVQNERVDTHVFVGEVLVQPVPRGGSQSGPIRISAGQSVRIEVDGRIQPRSTADERHFPRRTGLVNLARGKPIVSESASWPGPPKGPDFRYVAEHVVDGRIDDMGGSYWVGRDYTPNEHFTLDLGGNFQIERIELLQTHNGVANDRGTKEFELWASGKINDDRELVEPRLIAAGELPSAAGTGAKLPVFKLSVADSNLKPHQARYVRFVAKTFHGLGGGLNEIRIFGAREVSSRDGG